MAKEMKVVALKSKKASERKDTRIELFSINDTSYSIPSKIKPNSALKIMRAFQQQGDAAGTSFMLETLLGTEGYDALVNFDDLEESDLESIVKIAFELVAGATDGPKA